MRVPHWSIGLEGRHPTQALPALVFPVIFIVDQQTR